MKRVALAWSSGKDSAWALHQLRTDPTLEVVALFTTFDAATDRVTMHGVPNALVEAQAASAGLPLWAFHVPWPCSNLDYEQQFRHLCARAQAEGVTAFAFGDLFLAEIRSYRENQLAGTGIQPLFPLWLLPTRELAQRMMDGGIRAKLTCLDLHKLDFTFVGREFDRTLLRDLPPGVDPCGENGEFHTFVYEAPVFQHPIPVLAGVAGEGPRFATLELRLAVSL